MLLEWELAVEKLNRSEADVLPILVGQKKDIITNQGETLTVYRRFFDDFRNSLDQFPDEFHVHPKSPKRHTIRGLLETLLNLQAIQRLPDDVGDMARDAREMYARSQREARLKIRRNEVATKELHAALDRLHKALQPLDFDEDRKALEMARQPGTRTWLLDEIFGWLNDSAHRLFWLKGNPGVGKSVMAAMVANALQSGLHLGATFFCKHDDLNRRDALKLLHTIACGLARWDYRVAHILDKYIRVDSTVVLVIDALDECGEKYHRSDILTLLAVECAKLPSFVKMFITSRMEDDIVTAFSRVEPYRLLDPSEHQNVEDLRIRAQAVLSTVINSTEEGPLLPLIDTIITKSAGIFVWLTIARPFLEECTDLIDVRKVLEELPAHSDGLYERALQAAYTSRPLLQQIVPIVLVSQEPLPSEAIASLLDLPVDDVKNALKQLAGVVSAERGVKVRHKSLADYLTDPEKCKNNNLLVQPAQAHLTAATKCVITMNQTLRRNMCQILPHEFNADIEDLPERIEANIPSLVKKRWGGEQCSSFTANLPDGEVT
ncbi:hypothetical protein HDV00_010670 [Rhizophlyctis rosea]|nr:hypothetical protein HDV00_010670 [Rhizophlyctis rosea]